MMMMMMMMEQKCKFLVVISFFKTLVQYTIQVRVSKGPAEDSDARKVSTLCWWMSYNLTSLHNGMISTGV